MEKSEKGDILVFEKVVRLLFPPGSPGCSSTSGLQEASANSRGLSCGLIQPAVLSSQRRSLRYGMFTPMPSWRQPRS